ncbi:histidine phosphatase family protein [Micromonospora sp. NPDC049679]|uniref:histidine phosphatase family protein n=1 Tax=Micromonospora sp. NPDC049679 TaxID=3155920 RepID=UPI00340B3FED
MANRFLYLARHGAAVDDGVLSEVGRQQATLLGERLRDVPLSAIHHGPLPRARETADLVAACAPHVPTYSSDLLGDYLPAIPDGNVLPADLIASYSAADLADGPSRASAAIERHAVPAEQDTHELIVTHNFLIAWFVRHALDAPPERWPGLNQGNCALTVILYRPRRPPSLLVFNDMTHLPPPLRWTGFPQELRV